MTNQERQRSLDKEKWLKSEELGTDLSGCMIYCDYCYHQVHTFEATSCDAPSERESRCLCASAYNRMKRGKHKGVKD